MSLSQEAKLLKKHFRIIHSIIPFTTILNITTTLTNNHSPFKWIILRTSCPSRVYNFNLSSVILTLTLLCTGSEISGYWWMGGGHFKDTLLNKPLKSIFGGSNGHVALQVYNIFCAWRESKKLKKFETFFAQNQFIVTYMNCVKICPLPHIQIRVNKHQITLVLIEYR